MATTLMIERVMLHVIHADARKLVVLTSMTVCSMVIICLISASPGG